MAAEATTRQISATPLFFPPLSRFFLSLYCPSARGNRALHPLLRKIYISGYYARRATEA